MRLLFLSSLLLIGTGAGEIFFLWFCQHLAGPISKWNANKRFSGLIINKIFIATRDENRQRICTVENGFLIFFLERPVNVVLLVRASRFARNQKKIILRGTNLLSNQLFFTDKTYFFIFLRGAIAGLFTGTLKRSFSLSLTCSYPLFVLQCINAECSG